MRRLLLCGLVSVLGSPAFSEEPPNPYAPDVVVNEGEHNCIYEIVGTDSCPSIEEAPSAPCPSGCGQDSQGWFCALAGYNHISQSTGFVNNNTGATAPKWSAPSAGVSGWVSTITSAVACGVIYDCNCKVNPNAPFDPSNPNAAGTCESKQKGLSMLWTLAKLQPELRCVVLEPEPIID